MEQLASPWNSLEVAKIVVSVLTPVMVLVIGLWINRSLKRLEHLQWANQKIVEKRIAVFDELAPLLNDLLCFFTFVGCWKDLKPPDVVKLKRTADRIVHVNAALFNEAFLNTYHAFMDACYSTYAGWGQDAKLRTAFQRRKEAWGDSWLQEWEKSFSREDEYSDPKAIRSSYGQLMSLFAAELGVGLQRDPAKSGRIPENIR